MNRSTEEETAANPEITEDTNEKPKEAKIVADMYSPVLWETKKRNSSKSSISNEKETTLPSAAMLDHGKSSITEVDHSNHSQSSTPDVQPPKSMYTAVVTDSGYTTASSPTSTNQESPNDNGIVQPDNRVTTPSNPNTLESLMKSWDVKAKIQNLEKTKADHNIPKIAANLKFPVQKKAQGDVKSKAHSFEEKNNIERTPTPTPPKRKRSLSAKNKDNSPKTSSTSSPLKPVSLNFTSSNSNAPVSEEKEVDSKRSVKSTSECSSLPSLRKELASRETNPEMTDTACSESQSNGHVNLPLREESVSSSVSSSCDTDSYVTDSSDSALRSEHETPINSDTDSINSQHSPTPEYKNSTKDSKTMNTVVSSLDDRLKSMGEDNWEGDSREGSQERHMSRESSQEPTTSCSSWDSSQETSE